MSHPYRHGLWLSNGWLVFGVSVLSVAALTLLLWNPWESAGHASASPLRFFCAAGMSKPVNDILKEYQEKYGATVGVNFDGSGKLLSVIRAGRGEGDLYLAADASHMDLARKAGLVAEVIPVASIRPVLIVNRKTQQQLKEKGQAVTGLRDLLRADLKVVLANPDLASIGQLTRQVLEPLGIWGQLQKDIQARSARVSTVGTVQEVGQTVQTRDNYLGVVWSANAAQWADIDVVPAPQFAKVVEQVQIGVLTKSTQPSAALHLARYLTAADRGAKVFAKHHFEAIADADSWADRPELHLAAGAMLKPGVEDIIKAFSQREGVTVNTSFAGCGMLVSQMKSIQGGAKPGRFPDAYFACDQPFLDSVQDWFEAGVQISKNDVVLIVQKGNPKNVKSLNDLTREELRIGLAHPTHSALGKLTDSMLRKLNLYDKVYAQQRSGPVIHSDAAHLLVNQMRAGALDVAVVYRSNVLSAPSTGQQLDMVDLNLPEALATQPFAVAKNSQHRYLMKRLLEALTSPESAARFRSLGFQWVYQK